MEIRKRERNNVIIFDIIRDFQKPTINTGTLHRLIKDQLNEGKRNFLINLESVDNIDDVGVGELLSSLVFVSNLGGKLKFFPLKFWPRS
jgi:anti-anti-sigma regulatory factor